MMERKTFTPEQALSLNVKERRLGKKICELKHVTKTFDNRPIITDFSYTFKQKERIGILGPNGTGKTTLLNLIMDKLSPDSGEVDVGINTVFGYFDQHSQDFDPNQTIYEHVTEIGTQIKNHEGTTISAAKLLEQFLFPGHMLKTQIGKLSGGEKRRLHLVCLLLKNPNFLLFDEPTNDLDIQTLSVLEDFLSTFAGCVIVISHDRYFMDRVVDQLFVFKTGGKITSIEGNYTDYNDAMKDIDAITQKKSQPSQKPKQNTTKTGLSYTEQKELNSLEKEIEALETETEKLSHQLATKAGDSDDYTTLCEKIGSISKELNEKLARWETLAERA